MNMKNLLIGACGIAAVGVLAEYLLAGYFVKRILIRSHARRERTQDMSGTDWSKHIPIIREAKKRRDFYPHEEVSVTSFDGLKLSGTWFPYEDSKRVTICFHGYTSEGLNDYSTITEYYRENQCNLLIVDERAHGKSEGTYVGFGCLDRKDAVCWIDYVIERMGEQCQIMLHGISMGGATVLMASGQGLPKQVKGIISDCAFTSAWEVFASVLKTMYHLPPFPLLNISNRMVKKMAGYCLNECDAREEVKKSKIPTVFIHGDEDNFVPVSMVYELYAACAAEKKLVVIPGAAHAEAPYKDAELYRKTINEWITRFFE